MYKIRPKSIGSIVQEFVDTYTDRQGILRGMVLSTWREVLGSTITDQIQKLSFDKQHRLVLHVGNASWRHEIHMQREQIKHMLNQRVGDSIINEIIVRA
jgi:predicted nucleic acid-binding Zn ribbon protein